MAKKCSVDAETFELFSPSEVCDFLKEKVPGVSESVLERVIDHKIDGEVYVQLNDEYVKELAPLLGDRLKIQNALTSLLVGRSKVSFFKNFIHRYVNIMYLHFTAILKTIPLLSIPGVTSKADLRVTARKPVCKHPKPRRFPDR